MSDKVTLFSPQGYIFLNNVLTHVFFKKVTVSIENDDLVVTYETTTGQTFVNPTVYESPQAFEQGWDTNSNQTYMLGDMTKSLYHYDTERGFVCDSVEIKYEFTSFCHFTIWHSPKCILPEGYYETRGECIADTTYTEIDCDGVKVTHMGANIKAILNDEQKALIESFTNLLEEMMSAKLAMFYDQYHKRMYWLNGKYGIPDTKYRDEVYEESDSIVTLDKCEHTNLEKYLNNIYDNSVVVY